jgi:hypothetical protein
MLYDKLGKPSYAIKAQKSNCVWITNVAFHLQNLHFGFKSCVSFTNIQLSFTNTSSHFTKWHLALLLSNKNPKYRKIKENMLTNGK